MTDTTTVVARYLALGGAHVTIAKNVETWTFDEKHTAFVADCEACGRVAAEYDSDHRREGYILIEDPEEHALSAVEKVAAAHAEKCRRIPERLWPHAQVTR